LHILIIAGAAALTTICSARSAVDFQRDIQPILAERCVKCHGPEKQKSGLRLDSKASAFKGGDSEERGIVAGDPNASRLFQAISSADDDERMPPRKDGGDRLTTQQIELFRQWIQTGANWPESASVASRSSASEMKVTDADRQHWSFRSLQSITPPSVTNSASIQTPVDQFICAALEAKALAPSAPADARVLVRRIYFDLIGLPPTPAEIKKWTRRIDDSRDAVRALVDELLASPHYGERWARHWLDVARYADSNGMENDADRPTAYRFRDFIIRALNDDLPYDTFIRWQLAGDELAPDEPEAIAATGFLVAGVSSGEPAKMEEEALRNRTNELDDIVATTGQAMLGLTLACARCHDHKYDPIPTRDYYRMMGIFNNGDRGEAPLAAPATVQTKKSELAAWQLELDAATKERDDWLKKAREPLAAALRAKKIAGLQASDDEKSRLTEKPDDPATKKLADRFKKELKIENAEVVAALPDDAKARWNELDNRVKTISKRKPAALPTAFAFVDFSAEPRESWLYERGDFMSRNEKVDLGFLTVLTAGKTPAEYWARARAEKRRADTTQQRRALAEWMTDIAHGAGTLLARVMVNRVWQHHFGEGLVRTVSDFGTRGETPSHPQLLEWLTAEFVQHGWSLKHLHRLIVNSATYQQASAFDKTKAEVDPENRLLWRRRPMRLESEILRDAMLAASGSLNPKMFGPSFKPPIAAEALQARNVKDPYPLGIKETGETQRRTIYMFHKRVVQYPLMQAFDAPDAQVSCGRRVNTTVAPQALALLNDAFVRARADDLAWRLQQDKPDALDAQIDAAFQLCVNRAPSPDEMMQSCAFVEKQHRARQQRDPKSSDEQARQLALVDFCQAMFSLNEFTYID
jgi:hypothetical protein